MRNTMVKLFGLLIALTLVLSGCNLIGTDQAMVAAQELKKLESDMAAAKERYTSAVVATYNGGEVTQEDVMGPFMNQYSYYSYIYSMYGTQIDAGTVEGLKESAVQNAVENVAIAKELEARGLDLSEETLSEIDSEVEESYSQLFENALANADGADDAVREKQAEYQMYLDGFSRDSLKNMELGEHRRELIEQTLRDEITEVTDEELQAAYDAQVEEDQSSYASARTYESAMTSEDTVACWNPEGYRTVKHILVKPETEVQTAMTDARSALEDLEDELATYEDELAALSAEPAEDGEDAEAEAEASEAPRAEADIQADIDRVKGEIEAQKDVVKAAEDAVLDSLQVTLEEIYDKLDDGETFDSLIESYGEDPGMQNEPTKTRGYYVSANSENWDKNFTEGAMALENIGDVSDPVLGSSGVHIIRYESDVTPGVVPLEEVHDQLYDNALEDKKSSHYTDSLASWVEALKPQYNYDAFVLG